MSPDELPHYAPELVRSLLHCRVPEWAQTDPGDGGPPPEERRKEALVALLAAVPLQAGDQALAEVYSPHLDLYQRMLLLDSLAGAALELADPRCAPQLALGEGAPRLLPPGAGASGGGGGAIGAPASGAAGGVSGAGALAAPGMRAGQTRTWGSVAAAQRRAGSAGGATPQQQQAPRTWRNRFAPVASRWAGALLRDCDTRGHGVDLFGRDALLLGRLLTVLATFVEAAGATPAALPLAAGLLELLRAPGVSASPEPHVRRCALLAGAAVVGALPPARLAGALVGAQRDAADAHLVERLQWLQSWAAGVAAGDGDDNCRALAAGLLGLHGRLADEAMQALELLPEQQLLGSWDPLAASLGGKQQQGSGRVSIAVPSIQSLRLGGG